MWLKATASLLTLLANFLVSMAITVILLIVMNGYNQSDAYYGLLTYIFLSTVITMASGYFAFKFTGRLAKRNTHVVVDLLVVVIGLSILGALLKTVSSMIGLGVAEVARRLL